MSSKILCGRLPAVLSLILILVVTGPSRADLQQGNATSGTVAKEGPDRAEGAGMAEGRGDESPLDAGGFTSATVCARCHAGIHARWAESSHATAGSGARFSEALALMPKAAAGETDEARRSCLSCHSPTSLLTGDLAGKTVLTREGVTCSFCHSVTSSAGEWRPDAFWLEPGRTVQGPHRYGEIPGHESQFSPLQRSSLLCAPCHQYQNAAGIQVLDTYGEWKAGVSPTRGVQCQDCHMGNSPGDTGSGGETPAPVTQPDGRMVNLHGLDAGSAPGRSGQAILAGIREVTREEDRLTVVLDVTNTSQGHSLPSGLPSRSVILRIEATSDGEDKPYFTDTRAYRRELLDGAGKIIFLDSDAFTNATSVQSDTRIRPGETRSETFVLSAPAGPIRLEATLDEAVRPAPGSSASRRTIATISTTIE